MLDVLLVDDHPLLQLGLKGMLTDLGLTVAIGDITDRDRLLADVAASRPTTVVLDYGLPSLGDGLGLIGPIRELDARVLMLTGTIDEALWGAFVAAGAEGVVSKGESLDEITDAILAVVAGQPIRVRARSALLVALREAQSARSAELRPFLDLTKRERVVLHYLVQGTAPSTIAAEEFVSIDTVRSQIKSILRKLGVNSQLEAVALTNRVSWTLES